MKNVIFERRPTTFFFPALDLLAVWNAASKEEARYYLRGVYIETTIIRGPAVVHLVATDGSILLRKTAPNGAFVGDKVTMQSDSYYSGFILTVDVMEKAFKGRGIASTWIYGDSDTGILEFLEVSDMAPEAGVAYPRVGVCEFDRIDGTFPEWRRVMPKDGAQGAEHMAINPANMEKLFKAGRVYDRSAQVVKFSAASSSDPISVQFSAESDLLGVIMPMRF